ncbi:uncharacterized protein LOC111565470 isoform X8 [Amphiprion ocellaris]|uniref:uncharacterized protein LOC111565470 isoform X8 n=1 Tax=Amphiprion ocellaris TaxID=80972 RepID=UPI0016499FAD|nr:uncharacterized protein LOC111565470 isoform X8 [Amphiprion ocellaris]
MEDANSANPNKRKKADSSSDTQDLEITDIQSGTDMHTGHKLNACQEDFPVPGSVQVPEVVHKLKVLEIRLHRIQQSDTDMHTGHKLNACQEDFPVPGSVQVPEVVHKL